MSVPAFLSANLQLVICLAIVAVGLLIYGFFDLLRLHWIRIWGVSSVVYTESIRRRIWLIFFLVIPALIIVSQLIKPLDEQDAIRQTIKFCLFATGLIITVTAIILACTNLPREIENRVIYTIVTKPATRLEIVLGKIFGFARVSAMILLVMGVFTFAYLHLRAWQFRRAIEERLANASSVDEASATTLRHYRDAGLLTAKSLRTTSDFQIFSRVPSQTEPRRYMPGGGQGDFLVPFQIRREDLIPPGDPQPIPGHAGIVLALSVGYERDPNYVPPRRPEEADEIPPTVAAPTTKPTSRALPPPEIVVQILDNNQNTLIASRQINDNKPLPLPDPSGNQPVFAPISAEAVTELVKKDQTQFYVHVIGMSQGVEYFVDVKRDRPPAMVVVPTPFPNHEPAQILPMADASGNPGIRFRGRIGTAGQQLPGASSGVVPVAVFHFDNATSDRTGNQQVPFELKAGVERGDVEEEGAADVLTSIQFTAVNRATGKESPPVKLAVEANRQTFFSIPAEFTAGGNFDILARCLTQGHYVGLTPESLSMVAGTESFDFNLLKSLLIMWLMSILVISVSIFCSTFLSWPIAIVLTLVILLGRWGVEQLGDATQPGIGNVVATDMGFTDPSKAKVVSASIEKLAAGLNALAAVLPDISRFSATEDIERGLTVPAARLTDSLKVLASYGLATLTLAYVFLRLKEVAP